MLPLYCDDPQFHLDLVLAHGNSVMVLGIDSYILDVIDEAITGLAS